MSITASQFGFNYTEVQYGKVYEYSIPGVGNRYIMLHMLIGNGAGRDIALSISDDGKTFTPFDRKLIDGANCGQADIAGPVLEVRDGRYFVLFNCTVGDMRICEVGSDFSLEKHLGIFYKAMAGYPDKERAAAPFFVSDTTNSYMFYESGVRQYTFNSSGVKQLRVVVTGKNSSSSGYTLGSDKILLVRN